ncbi:MAG: ATP-binding protein [Solirubrobacteraceae bacterium]
MHKTVSDVLNLDLPCDRYAPRAVRAALDEIAGIDGVRDDARLVATELVTDAVLHSGCDEALTLSVSAGLRGDRLRISVRGPGRSAHQPRTPTPPGQGRRGPGLQVIELLASRWASERSDACWAWVEIDL